MSLYIPEAFFARSRGKETENYDVVYQGDTEPKGPTTEFTPYLRGPGIAACSEFDKC